ncbi:MAG TPA: hypothetical protein VGP22_04895, partial [Albitalea sp.]|nr:hypothetical protein [Albitalea sp.]
RVSWESVSFAAAPTNGSGMAAMVMSPVWGLFLRVARSLSQLHAIFKSCELISYCGVHVQAVPRAMT